MSEELKPCDCKKCDSSNNVMIMPDRSKGVTQDFWVYYVGCRECGCGVEKKLKVDAIREWNSMNGEPSIEDALNKRIAELEEEVEKGNEDCGHWRKDYTELQEEYLKTVTSLKDSVVQFELSNQRIAELEAQLAEATEFRDSVSRIFIKERSSIELKLFNTEKQVKLFKEQLAEIDRIDEYLSEIDMVEPQPYVFDRVKLTVSELSKLLAEAKQKIEDLTDNCVIKKTVCQKRGCCNKATENVNGWHICKNCSGELL